MHSSRGRKEQSWACYHDSVLPSVLSQDVFLYFQTQYSHPQRPPFCTLRGPESKPRKGHRRNSWKQSFGFTQESRTLIITIRTTHSESASKVMFLKNVASLDTGRANKPSDKDGNIGSLPLRFMMAREGEEDVGQSKEIREVLRSLQRQGLRSASAFRMFGF